ncbi:MAG: GNAT family N-acetyltransferase [Rhizobiales bacterium]|nr:GNAT family N-acetyltransferase [Hyphomicrobiales bacterium]
MISSEIAADGDHALVAAQPDQPRIPRYIDKQVIRRVQSAYSIHSRTITSVDAMAGLRDDWNALAADEAGSIHGFQTFDWCYAWAKTHCSPDGATPHIVMVYHGGRLVLVWPLMKTCIGPICVMRWLSDPFGQYGDVISVSDSYLDSYLDTAWKEICEKSGAATVRLRHVRTDATCHAFLANFCEIAEQPVSAPYLDLTPFNNLDAYDARYSRIQRRRRKRIAKHLEKFGEIKFIRLEETGHLNTLIDQIISQKTIWLRNRGYYSQALTGPHCAQFLKSLADQTDGSLKLVTTVLMAGKRAVSFEIGLRYKGRHMCLITAHDNNITDMSPGRLHMHHAQRQALADGQSTFDLMVPGDPYKQSWSNDAVQVADFYTSLNTRGRIFSHGFLKTVRPIIRRLYHAAPPKLRRKLIPLIA